MCRIWPCCARGETGGVGRRGTPTLTCLELLTWREKDLASALVALGRGDPGHRCHDAAPAQTAATPRPKPLARFPCQHSQMCHTQEPSQRWSWRTGPSGARRVCTRVLTCGEKGQSEPGTQPLLDPLTCWHPSLVAPIPGSTQPLVARSPGSTHPW